MSFFVRTAANTSRVRFFHDRRLAGEELEAVIVCSETKMLIDGRQRVAGALQFGDSMINVEYRKYNSQLERVSAALAANSGGALPPSPDDICHTIEYLLSLKIGRKAITAEVAKALGVSEIFVKNSVKRVIFKLRTIQLNKATKAIADDGLTVTAAAVKFGVEELDLKLKISTNSKDSDKINFGTRIHNVMTGASKKIGQNQKLLLESVSDGEVSVEEAKAVIDRVEKQLKVMLKSNEEWLKRYEQAGLVPSTAHTVVKTAAREKRKYQAKKSGRSGLASSALAKMGLA